MIHGVGHSSDEFKVLDKFGTNYDVAQPTKYRESNPVPSKRFHKNNKTMILLTMWWMKSKLLNPKSKFRES